MRDGDDDALLSAATGCEAQAMEEHAAEDIKHFRPTTVRLPAARSLPLGLAYGGACRAQGPLTCFNGQLIPVAEFANALKSVTISRRARYLLDHGPRRRRARPRPRSAAQEAAAQLAREAWLASIPHAKPSWRRPRAEIQQAEIERLEGST